MTALPIGSNSVSIDDFPLLHPKSFQFGCIYPDCELVFTLTNNLYNHIRDHKKELICPVCNIEFKCMASLVYHVRTHTGSKPYICPLPNCKFVTATKGNLKAHLLANSHKEIMSLDLLNVILSLDTNHARPEVNLQAPRQRKKRLQSPDDNAFRQPPRKRNRSSESVELGQVTNPFFASGLNTSNFYQQRSPATSLTHQWQDFNFMSSARIKVAKRKDDREDLTVRIKKRLYDSINQMNDGNFLMVLGDESTSGFYARNKFGRSTFLRNSNSNTPPFGIDVRTQTHSSSEEPKYEHDLELIAPL